MFSKKIFFILSIVILLVTSCDEDVEINLPDAVEQRESMFTVDFDGETWLADTATATILDGEIIITAFKNGNQEKVVLSLNTDQVGTYTLSENENIGSVVYQDDLDTLGAFATQSDELSGRIDLEENDIVSQLLTGKFFFIGKRTILLRDENGNAVLDANGDPIYIEESKDFTNGIFENIVYTTTVIIDPEDDNNQFFVKIDDVEFVETTLTAIKADGFITIRATKNGANEIIEIKMPDNVVTGRKRLYTVAPNPDESTAIYTIVRLSQSFGPADPFDTDNTRIVIDNHNQITNTIEGTFRFIDSQIGGGTVTHTFTDGSFTVTYVE